MVLDIPGSVFPCFRRATITDSRHSAADGMEIMVTVAAMVAAIMAAVAMALEAVPEVSFAYLFGSRAAGRERPDSDMDLAVGLRAGHELPPMGGLREKILATLAGIAPSERIDLVSLDQRTALLLRQQVFRHGRLLFERDKPARVRLQVRTANEWCDQAPVRERLWRITRHRILEGRWSTQKS